MVPVTRRRLLSSLLLLLGAAAAASGQLEPGDLLVADLGTAPGVYGVTDAGKRVATLLTSRPDFPNALAIHGGAPAGAGGPGMLAAMVGAPDRLLGIAPGGAVSTLLVIPYRRPNGLALDPDGTWLITASGGGDGLLRYDPVMKSITTLWRNPFGARVNSVAVDLDTGHYGVALFGRTGPRVVEVDSSGRLVTTLDATLSDISSIAWDPATGTYTLTDFLNSDPAEFVRLDPATRRVTSLVAPAAMHFLNAHARTQRRTWWLAGGRLTGGGGLHEVTDRGVFVKSFALPWPGAAPSAVVVYGGRPLSTSGQAAPGRVLTFHLTSQRPGDRGKPFALLVSLASRPGITFSDGRRMDIRLDALAIHTLLGTFRALLGGGSNLGRLDPSGNATARLTLPSTFPPKLGVRLFAAFAVLDPAAPAGLGTVSNTVGFPLQ